MSYRKSIIFFGISVFSEIKLIEERRESEDAAQNGSMPRLLRYEYLNSEVEREQAQKIQFANIKARTSLLIFNKVAT